MNMCHLLYFFYQKINNDTTNNDFSNWNLLWQFVPTHFLINVAFSNKIDAFCNNCRIL